MAHPAEQRLKALLVSGLAGGTKDYRCFLEELSLHLRRYLRRRIPNLPDDAEDVLQEILAAVHFARLSYRPDDLLTAWVYAIARYKLMDLFKSRAHRESMNVPLDEHLETATPSSAAQIEARWEIEKLLQQLPEKQRVPVVHVKLHGLSIAETARLTGLSESAVKVGVHRGVKAMSELLRTLS